MSSGGTSTATGADISNVATFPPQWRTNDTIVVAPRAYGGFIAATPRLDLTAEFASQVEAIAYAQGLASLSKLSIDLRLDNGAEPTVQIFPIYCSAAFRLCFVQGRITTIGGYRSIREARLVADDIGYAAGWSVIDRSRGREVAA